MFNLLALPIILLCAGYEGVDSGFAHVIEDEQQFPEHFGFVRRKQPGLLIAAMTVACRLADILMCACVMH